MSKRWRNALIALGLTIVAAELWLQFAGGTTASVEIVNKGTTPILGLTATVGETRAEIPRIEPGEAATVRLSARGLRKLDLNYRQKSSSLSGIQIDDFDPSGLRREGQKLQIIVYDSGYQRFDEDDPHWTTRTAQRFKDWLSEP